MKKLLSLALAVVMTLALALPALAASPRTTPVTLTVNGKSVNTSKLPAVEGIPLRAFFEADGGTATWFAEERRSVFALEESTIEVDLLTGEATVEYDQVFTGCSVVKGVTFAPLEVVNAMTGVNVTRTATGYAITTPSGDPMVQLVKSIRSEVGMAMGMKAFEEQLNVYGVDLANFVQLEAYMPMMIRADTVIVGKVAEGKMAEAKANLEACKARTIQNFVNYLPDPLEMARNGKVVSGGEYVMLIISGDNDKAVELFNAFVKAR